MSTACTLLINRNTIDMKNLIQESIRVLADQLDHLDGRPDVDKRDVAERVAIEGGYPGQWLDDGGWELIEAAVEAVMRTKWYDDLMDDHRTGARDNKQKQEHPYQYRGLSREMF